jgi:hypothetical protein
MGRLAIQRTSRPGKEVLEVPRGRHQRVVRIALYLQPTSLQESEGSAFALLNLRAIADVVVSIRRRVHEAQKPFRPGGLNAVTRIPVLGTYVDRWPRR